MRHAHGGKRMKGTKDADVEMTCQVDASHSASTTPNEAVRNAKLLTGPSFAAMSIVCEQFGKPAEPRAVLAEIDRQTRAVQAGDLSGLEATLVAQTVGLNAMFCDLATRAKQAGSMAEVQALTQLALKAQSGARATIQAIAEVKTPRQVAFVQQANIATHQQINTHAPTRKKSARMAPNKLIAQETIDGSTHLDGRTKASAGGAHPRDPALASRHRADKRRG